MLYAVQNFQIRKINFKKDELEGYAGQNVQISSGTQTGILNTNFFFFWYIYLPYKFNFRSSCHHMYRETHRDNIPFTGNWYYTLRYTCTNYTCLNNSGCCSPVSLNPKFHLNAIWFLLVKPLYQTINRKCLSLLAP